MPLLRSTRNEKFRAAIARRKPNVEASLTMDLRERRAVSSLPCPCMMQREREIRCDDAMHGLISNAFSNYSIYGNRLSI